jgi:RNA polymerase sigma-70 factor, ECF subfamily
MPTLQEQSESWKGRLPAEDTECNTPFRGSVLHQPDDDLTELLRQFAEGDERAREQIFQILFPKLLKIASERLRRERPAASLTSRDLVQEAYLRVEDQVKQMKNASQVYAMFAIMMRRILVDRARRKAAGVHGRDWIRITFDPDLPVTAKVAETVLVVHHCLEKFEQEFPRAGQVVDLRFFGGLTNQEVADTLGVCLATVEGDWRFAKAWLRAALEEGP